MTVDSGSCEEPAVNTEMIRFKRKAGSICAEHVSTAGDTCNIINQLTSIILLNVRNTD